MPQVSDPDVICAPAPEGVQRSVRGYALLVALAFLLVVPGAYLVSPRTHVGYTAEGKLWVEGAARRGTSDATPEGGGSVPGARAWIELLRSHEVLHPVVLDRRLSIQSPEMRAVPSPQDAARDLAQRLMVATDREGSVIHVALEGTNPQEAVRRRQEIKVASEY
jgi:uncharacterized protein involved in exopolysaccharide biosynthesis